LDRFDKHGLLSYYAPFHEPPGRKRTDPPYEYSQDFDFAVQNNIGLVFWNTETRNDTAEGLANLPEWDWAANECLARGLPMHINTAWGQALWLTNRYRNQTMQKQPQYCGSYYQIGEAEIGAAGILSWMSEEGEDVELGILQDTVRRFAGYPNVVGWLEPHGETDSPPCSLLVEYGDVADRAFRRFLQGQYTSPMKLSEAWYADPRTIRSWADVHVPQLASFLGWGPEALDLTGDWKIAYLTAPDGHAYTRDEARSFGNKPTPAAPVPQEWYQTAFDDRGWGTIRLPGNDRQMFLPHSPTVIRQTLAVTPEWLNLHPQQWLYMWDLSDVIGETYPVYVNGQLTNATGREGAGWRHWGVAEVTGLLRPGANLIAMRLPKGLLGYRCYIAPTPPLQYPSLGALLNARWADFIGWSRWARAGVIRRGAEMIRQVDPDRPINFMHPDFYADTVNQTCADFGGHFHNTGYMAGLWAESNPILARGAGRPATAEPGGPAKTALEFQAFWGRWLTEGIQSVHYFLHLGDILWNPSVRQTFADNRAIYEMIGKYHVPRAEVAILYGLRSGALTSWPWGSDPNTNMTGGYWAWNTAFPLLTICSRDGVTEVDFETGNTAKYRVVIDSNTSIMTPELVAKIEQYVRTGGTFVTFVQTGRHTPAERDSWPINRLTGYEVLRIDPYGDRNRPKDTHALKLAPGQPVFQDAPWSTGVRGSGLSLKKAAAECQDLMLWEDGTVAAGMRPLGRGNVVHLGVTFDTLGDRSSSPLTRALLGQIVEYLKIEKVPGQARDVMMRHYISNNGLYDVWMLFNESQKVTTTDLTFSGPIPPQSVLEIKTGQSLLVTSEAGSPGLFGLTLQPMETRLLLSPRRAAEFAPLEWLSVQRDWWAGTTSPAPKQLPTPTQDQLNSVDLTEGWAFQPVDSLSDGAVAALAASDIDDARWERRRLGIWGLHDHPQVKRAVLRRRFTVPTSWNGGETQLWVRSWFAGTFRDRGRIFLDGKLLQDFSPDGLSGIDAGKLLPPGSAHVITLDVAGNGTLCGAHGSAWIYHIPEPLAKMDLTGRWDLSVDGVHDSGSAGLPGSMKALFAVRRVTVDSAQAHRNAVIYIHADGPVFGVLINGEMICRHHHLIGQKFLLNITPKVKFGGENRLELITRDPKQASQVHALELRFYDRQVYP
jgi:hypothetical protein